MESYKSILIDHLFDAVRNEYGHAELKNSAFTEHGFYCDFDLPEPIGPEAFGRISAGMRDCGLPGAYELTSFSGAYENDGASGVMLQRIYATAFDNEKDFEEHKLLLAEAALRDHKTLGRRLKLFLSSEEAGGGLIMWSPRGAALRMALERFAQEAHVLNGYEWVYTPHIGRERLWRTSGHLDYYRDSMYAPLDVDGENFYLKPVNCPFHILIYNSELRSYRDLPLKYAEFGTVYRYELSGALSGLTRVRGFTQDDAHIICTPEQLGGEIRNALKFSLYILRSFGLTDFTAYISTKPGRKAIGSDGEWEVATRELTEAVESEGLRYFIDEGGGAFYGPKIDLKLRDALGNEWQCSTIQFDFNIPPRFKMSYVGRDGKKHTPFMVHRALFGSIERFAALLIEHYRGDFPLWFAPVQAGIVPVAERHAGYAEELKNRLTAAGLRVRTNADDVHMREKIKRLEQDKTPYALVVGDRDVAAGGFSVRCRKNGDLGFMTYEKFTEHISDDIELGRAKKI